MRGGLFGPPPIDPRNGQVALLRLPQRPLVARGIREPLTMVEISAGLLLYRRGTAGI
jgi:hypothetical protein